LAAMMAERALVVSHTTTMRWVPTTSGIIIRTTLQSPLPHLQRARVMSAGRSHARRDEAS
jgi:transposase-like protein